MVTINTLYDLLENFTVYPMCLEYLLKDEDIMGYTCDTDEMREFFDKYGDYEVIDFRIKPYSSGSIELTITIKKGEPEDE